MSAETLRRAAADLVGDKDPYMAAVGAWLSNEAVSARAREVRARQISDEAWTAVKPAYDPSTLDAIAVARAYLGDTSA